MLLHYYVSSVGKTGPVWLGTKGWAGAAGPNHGRESSPSRVLSQRTEHMVRMDASFSHLHFQQPKFGKKFQFVFKHGKLIIPLPHMLVHSAMHG